MPQETQTREGKAAVRKEWLAATALAIALALSAVGCSKTGATITSLHAAAVPLRPPTEERTDPIKQYPELFPLQVAVLWTRPEESPLAVVHCLKQMGVPFFVTRSVEQAVKHRLVVIFPNVDAKTFTEADVEQFMRLVQQGGTILAQNVYTGTLKPLFGFRDFVPSRQRYRVRFSSEGEPLLKYLDRPEERETPLGSPRYSEVIWSNGYVPDPSAVALARFDDGTAALLSKSVGKGKTYLVGVSLTDVVLRPQSNRDYEAERHYVNAFEPGADVWMLLLRAWYESYAANWMRLATMPDGLRSVVLITHDVDWSGSFHPALDFARLEEANGIRSTFFIQTKYMSDANSKAFFDGRNLDDLRNLQSRGAVIGSHTVIHARTFHHFELGTGQETFASYRPRVLAGDRVSGGTVFGEVRVSKELLDGELPGQQTILFRAGHLRVPVSLPEALERSGYEFDSSFTACDVLTNFPYALPRGLGFEEDSALYEFPVTIEDEESPPLAERVPQALQLIRANADNNAANVVLIHTNEARSKLQAEQKLLAGLPSGVGVRDMLSFARFWRARDRLSWTVNFEPREIVLTVKAPEPVSGLTFEFARPLGSVSKDAQLLPDRRHVVLPELQPGQPISLHLRYAP